MGMGIAVAHPSMGCPTHMPDTQTPRQFVQAVFFVHRFNRTDTFLAPDVSVIDRSHTCRIISAVLQSL
jgi:hypothetical protein